MDLEQLRKQRAKRVLRACELARSTIREQRGELARIASAWNRIAKRINVSVRRYERTIESLGLGMSFPIRSADLLDCLKGCVQDEQIAKLEDVESELKAHQKDVRAAGRRRTRQRARRDARRAK